MTDLEFSIVKNKSSRSTLYQILNESEGCTLGFQVTVTNGLILDETSMDAFAITCLCDQIRSELFASLNNQR